jgi:hypothetical protein
VGGFAHPATRDVIGFIAYQGFEIDHLVGEHAQILHNVFRQEIPGVSQRFAG